jgi:hypothetical protein
VNELIRLSHFSNCLSFLVEVIRDAERGGKVCRNCERGISAADARVEASWGGRLRRNMVASKKNRVVIGAKLG